MCGSIRGNTNPTAMSESQSGKGRGCFFYGCLTLVVLFVVAAIGLYFGTRYMINRMVTQYTSATPMTVPKVEGTAEEVRDVRDRFKAFTDALKTGRPGEALSLSEKEINLLISNSPDTVKLKDTVHVGIVSNKLKGTLSLPLENLGLNWKSLRGRYLNGVAEVKASLQHGVLLVTLDALEVNGKPVPEQVMAGLRSQNLAKDLYKDAQSLELLRKIETIVVDDGRVLVKPAPAPAPSP